jgi:hypothetical protein
VLVRGLGVAYVAAFGSLAAQVDGLYGSGGILPIREVLDAVRNATGPERFWQIPSVLWLDASDATLRAFCWGGVALGLAAAAGLLPKAALGLAWLLYLSFNAAGPVFLSYQWDALLLESGLLGVLIAPWGIWLQRVKAGPPVAAVWLFRWLVFRLMFLSGWVKLASGDPTWRAWEALKYHYETQPLPTWTSWYAHQMPSRFQTASVGVMFWCELIAPFLIVGPRVARRVACASFLMLMAGIALTGNYGFFNILSAILCASLLDDRDLGAAPLPEPTGAPPWDFWRVLRVLALGVAAAVLATATTVSTLQVVWPRVNVPWPFELVRSAVDPLRSTNTYGLFAVMTTDRPEIIVEGSDDGATWRPYRFRWKPCEPDRRPRFTLPHLPRLDWQMWFAALSRRCGADPWFLRFERRLLEGAPAVLALLRENPFPDHPPRYVRARLFLYKFTRPGSRDWWAREDAGLFCPPLSLDDLGPG